VPSFHWRNISWVAGGAPTHEVLEFIEGTYCGALNGIVITRSAVGGVALTAALFVPTRTPVSYPLIATVCVVETKV
jgi:hypothetical protein